MSGALLLLPPLAFLILLAVFALAFWYFGTLGPKTAQDGGKRKPYACGEDLKWGTLQPGYGQFFAVAVLFTVLHVAVLVIATLPHGPAALLGLVYLAIMLFATAALVGELKTV